MADVRECRHRVNLVHLRPDPVNVAPVLGLEKDVGIANVKAVIRLRDVSVTSLIVSRK